MARSKGQYEMASSEEATTYRNRAEELRKLAASVQSPEDRDELLRIARQYEDMADTAI